MVESQPSKLLVAGSIPVSRSSPSLDRRPVVGQGSRRDVAGRLRVGAPSSEVAEAPTVAELLREAGRLVGRSGSAKADVAQLAEHVLGKDEVTSSILVIGSILRSARAVGGF